MSWRHMQAAGLLPLSRPPAKAVLLTLAHHANEFTGVCWPDVERIMQFTALCRRAVQGALRELEQAKLIKTQLGGRGRASTYTLHLPGCEPTEQGARHARNRAPHASMGAPHAPQLSKNDHVTETRSTLALLPDDWQPADKALAWAQQHFPLVDLEQQTEIFRNMSAKKGELYADANAAWKVWITRTRDLRDPARSNGNARGGDSLRQAATRSRDSALQ